MQKLQCEMIAALFSTIHIIVKNYILGILV